MTEYNPFDASLTLAGGGDDPEQRIPLPTADEEIEMSRADVPDELAILALRNTVLFPGVVLPITVGRDASLDLVRDAFDHDRLIGVVAQRSAEVEDPAPADLYDVGTVAEILKLIKMPDGSKSIVIQGKRRIRTTAYVQTEPYFTARVEPLADGDVKGDAQDAAAGDPVKLQALIRSIKELAIQIVNKAPNLPSEAAQAIENIESPPFLIHFIASNLQIEVEAKQAILGTELLVARAERVLDQLHEELQVLQLSEEIRSRVKTDVDEQQREYLLRQQMKAIQEELGEDSGPGEVQELRERAEAKDLPEHVQKQLDKELSRLARTNPAAPDYAVTRNYVDWILDLPWREFSEDQLDIARAQGVLDDDHYGLEDVKKRILEYLAVLKLKGDMKAPILCLHGPPGVGKTSLGKSVARALGREFVRMSLGGVRDEAEIRGHRRTYVGALPGRIIQGLKKAGTANPVMMLDEVDKLDSGFRGDPSSALLEVLDPEQNDAFNDHYLELDYDLSKVLFIATANYVERIPAPLRDRMEMIEITGYTQGEKLQIARQYLLPRQVERNGLTDAQLTLTDDTLRLLIDGYTRESGVRQLERTIGSVARGVAKQVALGETEHATVEAGDVEGFLGGRRFFSDVAERTEVPGVATGPGLDARRRRHPLHRSLRGAGRGAHDAHGPARRRDEGERAGRPRLREGPRRRLRHPARRLSLLGRARARAGGRRAQGRPLGGHRADYGARLGLHAAPRAPHGGHDGRDYAARPGAARGRHQGEGARGQARGHRARPLAEEKREGRARDQGRGAGGPGGRLRRTRGRGDGARAGGRPAHRPARLLRRPRRRPLPPRPHQPRRRPRWRPRRCPRGRADGELSESTPLRGHAPERARPSSR